MRRRMSTWIHSFADLPITSRYEVLDKLRLNVGLQQSLTHDLSRSRNALRTAFSIRSDISLLLQRTKDDNVKSSLQIIDKAAQDWLGVALSLDLLKHERITFDHASGLTLEKVARGESVHRVRSLNELKRRLHDGRRCFGFFHPNMESDPLVFVHVALTREVSASLSALDSVKDENNPTHAIFYSINSPHTAMRGLDIASLLIKETAKSLQTTFPTLHTFSTLSPIPKFTSYLKKGKTTVNAELLSRIAKTCQAHFPTIFVPTLTPAQIMEQVGELFTDESLIWMKNQKFCEEIENDLLTLGAYYIAKEKRQSGNEAVPIDDVARFHLRNGAIFHQINWMGNVSRQGLTSAAGMMVNYLYDFQLLEDNARRFGKENESIPLGKGVETYLKSVQ